jgi:hypothetical protein
VAPHRGTPPGRRGGFVDRRDRAGVALGIDPDAEPAVTVAAGSGQSGVRASTHDNGNRRVRRREHERLLEVEVVAATGDRLAGEQRPQHGKALIGPTPASRRVDPADLALVAVLAAHAHTQRQPPRGKLGGGGELAGDQHGMAQRQ